MNISSSTRVAQQGKAGKSSTRWAYYFGQSHQCSSTRRCRFQTTKKLKYQHLVNFLYNIMSRASLILRFPYLEVTQLSCWRSILFAVIHCLTQKFIRFIHSLIQKFIHYASFPLRSTLACSCYLYSRISTVPRQKSAHSNFLYPSRHDFRHCC